MSTSANTITQERSWTIEDVMHFFGCSRRSVYNMPLRWSKPPGVKGRRYDPADVRLYRDLHANRVPLRAPMRRSA